MAKMGRPKVDNPMERRITIRFTKEEYQKLDDFAKRGCMTKSEVLKKGLELLYKNSK
ncbi:hypothetical protein [Eubacterium ventriosum]|jgi:predicted DNA-binding protein|uniref:hypothetical protein n=1 Tax=Eubacterium ventriosum TaxID=39496 RepID=UPI003521D45C